MQNNHQFSGGYAAMNSFVAPIRPKAQLWRLILGMILILAVYVICVTIYFMLAGSVILSQEIQLQILGQSPLEMVFFLSSFIFLTLATALATIWPARRPLASLIGPLGPAWRDFWQVLRPVAGLMAIAFALVAVFDPNAVQHLPLAQFFLWLPLTIIVLLIQTSAEELVFRGFIAGQLAARFSSPMIWMVLPAVLFGALHYDPQSYGTTAWIVCLATMIFAILATDLTARRGNLGAAIALHFANNFFAIALIGETDRLDGLALYTAPMDLTDPIIVASGLLFTVLMWLLARIALRI
jgi:uncharacterized protein